MEEGRCGGGRALDMGALPGPLLLVEEIFFSSLVWSCRGEEGLKEMQSIVCGEDGDSSSSERAERRLNDTLIFHPSKAGGSFVRPTAWLT
jgi:hypothetical protein